MRGEAMGRVVATLDEKGIDLSKMSALEFFARSGDWQTKVYAPKVREICAWEIDQQFEADLRENVPNAEISIGNSFELAKEGQFANRFNFIVFDNPQCTYGAGNEYCEHFQALPLTKNLAKKGEDCVVIFNLNSAPFDYDQHPEWGRRRNAFYGKEDCSRLEKGFLKDFYSNWFEKAGFDVKDIWLEDRNPEYLHYLVCVFRK